MESENKTTGFAKPTNASELRLSRDLAAVPELLPGIELTFPDPTKIRSFKVSFSPAQGLWHRGKFEFSFNITREWPYQPPKVLLLTKVWHPNISEDGHVCLNILKRNYNPTLTIVQIIVGLQFLFNEPNPNDPLNHAAAEQYNKAFDLFKNKAEEYIDLYCPK